MKAHAKKDEFLAKVIHDLKTPTTAQIKALELFLSSAKDKISEKEKELVELTLNSCNYMQNLIETVSAVQKLEYEQQINLSYSKFDIVKLVRDVESELSVLLKYYDLKVEINTPEEYVVNADKQQIRRVVENILSNAINYSFKNTIIYINVEIIKNTLIVKVQNESTYIDPESLVTIFEKFKSFPTRKNKRSSGLGLYLSKEIIRAHYGQIIAQSYPDNINIFGFEIPVR